MVTAHVFQHKFSGVQIFVYHEKDQVSAKQQFYKIVVEHTDWMYLGTKQVLI